jgi:hypothetical protein
LQPGPGRALPSGPTAYSTQCLRLASRSTQIPAMKNPPIIPAKNRTARMVCPGLGSDDAEYTIDGQTFRPGAPRRWSEASILVMPNRSVDLAPDGKRFVVFPAEDRQNAASLHVTFLLNFFDELRRRVPAK